MEGVSIEYNRAMSGHSKWANIKHKKAANDSKRSQLFSKMSRTITLAVREGGGSTDPAFNVRLRLAVDRARAESMPVLNIERAIARASGVDALALKEVIYEGFGPGGVGLVVLATTDNPNRTSSDIRNAFERAGGKMGGVNSVLYQFDVCGIVLLSKQKCSEDDLLTLSEGLNGIEIEEEEEGYTLYIPFDMLGEAHEKTAVFEPLSLERWYKPSVSITVTGEVGESIQRLIDTLENLDDVEQVYSNHVLTSL